MWQSMGSQRVRHDLLTEQQQSKLCSDTDAIKTETFPSPWGPPSLSYYSHSLLSLTSDNYYCVSIIIITGTIIPIMFSFQEDCGITIQCVTPRLPLFTQLNSGGSCRQLRVLSVFSFLLLNTIPWCKGTMICLAIHLLKGTWIVSNLRLYFPIWDFIHK